MEKGARRPRPRETLGIMEFSAPWGRCLGLVARPDGVSTPRASKSFSSTTPTLEELSGAASPLEPSRELFLFRVHVDDEGEGGLAVPIVAEVRHLEARPEAREALRPNDREPGPAERFGEGR